MKIKKIIVFIILFIMLMPVMVSAANVTYSAHSSQAHTKLQIQEKYKNTVKYDYSKSIYTTKPSDKSPYVAGVLQTGVITDTLNRLNFYRWMYGADPVTINQDKMARNQKGAVVLSANDVLTHFPTQPTDMEEAFYNEAYLGCNVNGVPGDTYSGNCSYGDTRVYDAVDGYIHDLYNLSAGVGHRMSMLNPYATRTSFGQCGLYNTMSMYYEFEDTCKDLPEDFYAYPSPGYFPSDLFTTNQYWSLEIPGGTSQTNISNVKVQFKYNGQTYNAADIAKQSSNAIEYKMPAELITKLGGQWKKMPVANINVIVTGVTTSNGDNATYNYTVKFFPIDKVLKGINLNKTTTTIYKGSSQNLKLTYNPTNAVLNDAVVWKSSNENIVKVDKNGKIEGVGIGKASITVTAEGYSKTCSVTVEKAPEYILGDVNNDKKINTTDARETLLSYVGRKQLTATQKLAADVNKDGIINTADARQILLYYVGKINKF